MTVDLERAPRITFVHTLDPLPLINPTAAAQILNVRRHTLACYRHLNEGPAYYKFGRWIRYALTDLHARPGLSFAPDALSFPAVEDRACTIHLVDTPTAAQFLTVTRHCLANYREIGGGPRPHRLGRRIYYPVHELLRWARRQRRPGHRDVEGSDDGQRQRLDGDGRSVTYMLPQDL